MVFYMLKVVYDKVKRACLKTGVHLKRNPIEMTMEIVQSAELSNHIKQLMYAKISQTKKSLPLTGG